MSYYELCNNFIVRRHLLLLYVSYRSYYSHQQNILRTDVCKSRDVMLCNILPSFIDKHSGHCYP